mmetsp:Transcript_8058/g.8087  ORF Transcript_8058/g.8087 Transcript_8058/m.8087 type:complete len:638 (+) Transcript_8058:148-2061(+)
MKLGKKKSMNGLSISILTSLCLCLSSWYLSFDTVTCNVVGAGLRNLNGHYAAIGGIYFKRGEEISYFPDVFQIFSLRKDISDTSTLALTKHSWAMFSAIRKERSYINTPEHPDKYIFSPPEQGWKVDEQGKEPAPSVTGCKGSLQDSPPLPSTQTSNIGQLLQRPITTVLLGIIFYVAYVLYSSRTDPADVSFSYDKVVNQGEYWRMITASFSHFDAWHLLFNTMSLYQLGELEVTYGSVTFAFLNIDLVFITMGIVILCSHIMITKYGRADQTYSSAVGFSCVLFAWMVAASVRMKEFCPIFLLPSLCFSTYYLPNPLAYFSLGPLGGFPVNIGPVVLLVITKVIIPQSSFLGHLSGIIIGYPLAWNALNWLTPPIALALLAGFLIYKDNLVPFRFPGYESTPELSDLAPEGPVKRYKQMRFTMYTLCIFSASSILIFGPVQLFFRMVLIFLIWSAVQARRCEWLTDQRSTHNDCLSLLFMAAIGSAVAVMYDVSSLGAAVAAWELLKGCSLSDEYILTGLIFLIALVIVEISFFARIISCLNDIKLAESHLIRWRFNEAALRIDFKVLGLSSLVCCGNEVAREASRHVFDVPGRRLGIVPIAPLGENNPLLISTSGVPSPAPFPKMSNTNHGSLV